MRLTWLIRTAALSQVGLPASAAIGALAGWLVLAVVAVGYLLAVVVTFRPRTWKGRPELRSAAIGKWEVG